MPLLINGIDVTLTSLPPIPLNTPAGAVNIQCLPYRRPPAGSPIGNGGETTDGQRIRRVREAIHHINNRIRHHAQANRYFSSGYTPINGARATTLDKLLSGRNIIVCLDPVFNAGNFFGASLIGGTVLSITAHAFARSGRVVEATMIHELAHINGASNSGSSLDAENSLRHSRMGDQFDPTAFG